MRRRTDRGNRFVASLFAIATTSLAAPAFAQNTSSAMPPTGTAVTTPSLAPFPQIVIGRSILAVSEKTRQAYRDSNDNCICVPPDTIAAALGTTFTVDQKAGKAYFINTETGATATATLRVPPPGADPHGTYVALTPLAEALGGKCELDVRNNILYVRSVLTSVEMLGSQLRVKGTLPLWPKITRMNGGKTVAFDFVGAEVGTVSRNLTALGPTVVKARAGQFDGNTARIVLELADAKPFAWLPGQTPSTLAVLSSAPGVENMTVGTEQAAIQNSTTIPDAFPTTRSTAPPVGVTIGPDGKPRNTTSASPTKPTGKPAVPTLLKGVRFVRVSDTQARIIVDASTAPAVRTLLTKARLTLDVQNGVFGPGTQTTLPEATHPLLNGVQAINTSATTSQLLIDLSRAVTYTIRFDPKGGFTVDLTLPKGAGGRIAGKLIVVDAGHGGGDSGAKGVNGAREKDVALAIARRLADELRDKGANVIMTRDSDSFVELGERSNMSNRANADLFIAVHADSAGSSATGSTVYYHLNDASARLLAETVADEFREMGGIRTYGARSDGRIYTNGFSVLRRTNTLSILCETGYMSNSHDVSLLVQPGMQAKIARSIANGVQNYIEGGKSMAATTPSITLPAPSLAITPLPDSAPAPDPDTQVQEQPKN